MKTSTKILICALLILIVVIICVVVYYYYFKSKKSTTTKEETTCVKSTWLPVNGANWNKNPGGTDSQLNLSSSQTTSYDVGICFAEDKTNSGSAKHFGRVFKKGDDGNYACSIAITHPVGASTELEYHTADYESFQTIGTCNKYQMVSVTNGSEPTNPQFFDKTPSSGQENVATIDKAICRMRLTTADLLKYPGVRSDQMFWGRVAKNPSNNLYECLIGIGGVVSRNQSFEYVQKA